ncbi:MAG: glycosyltransferase [Verrucomicrobia bacterium]|nr:glycosyltransferase [Verrucomicrobiota bacterium]
MKTVCLNMIVKDESPVIERCLNSLKSIIDFWVIVDTGSKDGTQALIQKCLRNVPGKLYERPWVDFETNRNEALDLARNKTDYILFIDADERLKFQKPFDKSQLDKDYYLARMVGKNVDFQRVLLIKNHSEWRWKGALHEFITNPLPIVGAFLPGVINEYNLVPGNRARDPEKNIKDTKILEEALKKNPDDARAAFYLAQTYAIGGQLGLALKQYEKRVEMGNGNNWMSKEEVFWSLFCIAQLQNELQFPAKTIIDSFLNAWQFDEERAEPLYRLSVYLQQIECHFLGYLLVKEALKIPVPKFYTRLQRPVYDYLLQLKLAEFAYLLGRSEEAQAEYGNLLKIPNLPEETREMAEKNYMLLNGCTL